MVASVKLTRIPKSKIKDKCVKSGNVLENISTSSTKNIKMQQYICVRQNIPTSRLPRTILHENINEDRHLQLDLLKLSSRRERTSINLDINKRTFENKQIKKQEKWKREDEEALASWKLPSLIPPNDASQTIPCAQTVYTIPVYSTHTHEHTRKPILPMLKIKRERTEVIVKDDRTFVTRLPEVVEIDNNKLQQYNSYTGNSIVETWSNDERFKGLHSMLQPAILKKRDQYPFENVMSKSRASKFAEQLSLISAKRGPPQRYGRVVVATKSASAKLRAVC